MIYSTTLHYLHPGKYKDKIHNQDQTHNSDYVLKQKNTLKHLHYSSAELQTFLAPVVKTKKQAYCMAV